MNPMPPYNTASPAEWEPVSSPPFEFKGVTLRVFPLRADLLQLQTFCDRYLNLMPPEVAYFKPSAPFVYLILVDYGRMVSAVQRFGWVSQRETGFIVPLTQLRRRGGRDEFVDWASVAPYIWVDQPLSISTGREVYGWPKERGWFETSFDEWSAEQPSPGFRFRLVTRVEPAERSRSGADRGTLYEIRKQAQGSFLEWPPNLSTPFNLTRTWSQMLQASEPLLASWTGMVSALARIGPDAWRSSFELAARMGLAVWPLEGVTSLDNPSFNTINLKQFRDAEDPTKIAYQAVTTARMEAQRFGRSALMGARRILSGDPSGGFEVVLHDHDTYPIARTLGILAPPDEDRVISVQPFFPYEVELDMRYDQGEVLCWRSCLSDWSAEPSQGPVCQPAEYNTFLGKQDAPLPGPFEFPDVDFRFMPLLVTQFDQLERLVDRYLKAPLASVGDEEDVQPLPWVLLSVAQYDAPGNAWRGQELAFWVPLRRPDGSLQFMIPSLFTEDEVAVITLREVFGLPAQEGRLTTPPDTWLSGNLDRQGQPLLSLRTEVLPLDTTTEPELEQVVLELVARQPEGATRVSPTQKDRAALKTIREAIVEGGAIPILTLKQYRDVHDPKRACYQAMVDGEIEHRPIRTGAIEDDLSLKVYSYPSQPIMEALGLLPYRDLFAREDHGSGDGSTPVFELAPYHPFWLCTRLTQKAKRVRPIFPLRTSEADETRED